MQQMYVYESDGQKFELSVVCIEQEGKSTIVYDGHSKFVFIGAYMQEYSLMNNRKIGKRQKVSYHRVI